MVRAKVTSAAMASTRSAFAADLFLETPPSLRHHCQAISKPWHSCRLSKQPRFMSILGENFIAVPIFLKESTNDFALSASNVYYLTNCRNAFATTFKGSEILDRHKFTCQNIPPSNSIVRDQVICFFKASSIRHDLIQTSHQRELLSAF
jgi:hypothetical protein